MESLGSEAPKAAPSKPEDVPKPSLPTRHQAWPVLRRLIGLSRPYLTVVIIAILCGAAAAVARNARAFLAQPVVDDILVPGASLPGDAVFESFAPKLMLIAGLAAITVLVTPIAMLGKSYLIGLAVSNVRRDLDQAVAAKLLRVPLAAHRSDASGDLLARAMSDVTLAVTALVLLYGDVLTNIIIALIGLVSMFIASWPLALLTLTTVPPLMFLLNFFGQRIHRQTERRQKTQGDISQRLVGILSGIKVIKAFRGYGVEEQAFALETERYRKRTLKVVWNQAMSKSSTEALTQTVGFLILAAGVVLTLKGMWSVSLGTLTAFAVILTQTYKPVKAVTSAYTKVMESTAGAKRLFDLLDRAEEVADAPDARPMAPLEGAIRFRNVHFDYDGEPILRGIDLDVPKGTVVAIVGKTGAGKSTMIDLLLRFHDPSQGAIEFDGVDLRAVQRESFLDQTAVVAQEPFLFDVSILENIRYGRPEATLDDVRQAARAAQAEEFIEALPEGFETEVGEFGLRLSGGQRQRITIARAILRNAPLLVFDEATSSLDAKTERAIQEAIETLRGNPTIFIVSHRLSTIRDADMIVVLEAGRVIEVGNHDELFAQQGVYRELAALQGATDAAEGAA